MAYLAVRAIIAQWSQCIFSVVIRCVFIGWSGWSFRLGFVGSSSVGLSWQIWLFQWFFFDLFGAISDMYKYKKTEEAKKTKWLHFWANFSNNVWPWQAVPWSWAAYEVTTDRKFSMKRYIPANDNRCCIWTMVHQCSAPEQSSQSTVLTRVYSVLGRLKKKLNMRNHNEARRPQETTLFIKLLQIGIRPAWSEIILKANTQIYHNLCCKVIKSESTETIVEKLNVSIAVGNYDLSCTQILVRVRLVSIIPLIIRGSRFALTYVVKILSFLARFV